MRLNIFSIYRDMVRKNEEMERLLSEKKKLMPLPTLQFEVHVAEHCNLNCKGCDNFSCIAEQSFLDVTQYEKDMERLSYLCDGDAKRIHLMGGEPLLHPQLAEVAKITRKYFPRAVIAIYTNGLLLKKQSDVFWDTLKNENIEILTTEYPINLDYRELSRLVREKGVVYNSCTGEDSIKELFKFTLDLKGQQDERDSFLKCHRANACISYKDGKLFTCSVVSNIEHFNKKFKENLKVTPRDYIDIYEAESIDQILEFLAKPIPFCRYCNMNAEKCTFPWGSSKGEIGEWS